MKLKKKNNGDRYANEKKIMQSDENGNIDTDDECVQEDKNVKTVK